jgi:hypothetical protein
MKKTSVVILALFLGIAFAKNSAGACRKRHSTRPITNKVTEPLQKVDLPDTWIWNNINGVNYLTNLRN